MQINFPKNWVMAKYPWVMGKFPWVMEKIPGFLENLLQKRDFWEALSKFFFPKISYGKKFLNYDQKSLSYGKFWPWVIGKKSLSSSKWWKKKPGLSPSSKRTLKPSLIWLKSRPQPSPKARLKSKAKGLSPGPLSWSVNFASKSFCKFAQVLAKRKAAQIN